MSANIAIGNSIQNAPVSPHAGGAKPVANSYNQAQAASNVASVAGAAQSYVSQKAAALDRLHSRDVIRNIKQYLKHASSQHISEHAYHEVIASYQESMRSIFGETENEAVLHAEAQALLKEWKRASDAAARKNLVQKLSSFTGHVASVAEELQTLQQQADAEIAEMLADTNHTLRHLDAMNAALSSAHMLDQETGLLEEERDALLKTLSGYIGVESMIDNTGAVRAFIGQDTVLIGNGDVASLSYVPNMPAYGAPQTMLGAIRMNDSVDLVASIRNHEGKYETCSLLDAGALAGLQHARDVLIPDTLERFDYTITNLRNGLESLHHDAMQPAAMNMVTGNRKTSLKAELAWEGAIEIALQTAEEKRAVAPLKLNLAALDDGAGLGKVSVQTLLAEINHHFTMPEQRATLGTLDDVQLALLVQQLPTVPSPSINFDIELHAHGHDAYMFMHGVRVLDDTNKEIFAVDAPLAITLANKPFTTTKGSNELQVHLTKPAYGVVATGDMVYLPPLGKKAALHGVDARHYSGCFAVKRVTGNELFVELSMPATESGRIASDAPLAMLASYQQVKAVDGTARTNPKRGGIHCDLRAAPNANHYTVMLDIGANDAEGHYKRGSISYRIENNVSGLYNARYQASKTAGDAVLRQNAESGQMLEAVLTDEAGGQAGAPVGFVTLRAINPADRLRVFAGDSKQLSGAQDAESFSKYFGFYPLFAKNTPVLKHQPHVGAARHLHVHTSLAQHPEKLATPTMGADISCSAVDGISALHQHLCEQSLRAEEAVILAENTLEGYEQRVEAVEYIDPALEMTSIDIYHQSAAASARAIAKIKQLHQTLCAGAHEGA